MHSLFPCRLIVDSAAAGTWQMAVDETLLESAAERGSASLRFYGWSEPTLSLGYFQRFGDSHGHFPSRGCPVVRRQTGGSAILHDRELTYCLAVPVAHPLAADATRLYLAVHEALRHVLARLKIATTLRPTPEDTTAGEQPFLCFQRPARGDVLLGSAKVCGSAQRRRRGAILQHGSLLLAATPRAPELPGILDLCDKSPDLARLIESWGIEIGEQLRLAPAPGRLTEVELDKVRTLALEKYGTAGWNERR
ncbi:MAG: biotin/lipoate A/B protein ligase family protein [Pirellulales bacterium]